MPSRHGPPGSVGDPGGGELRAASPGVGEGEGGPLAPDRSLRARDRYRAGRLGCRGPGPRSRPELLRRPRAACAPLLDPAPLPTPLAGTPRPNVERSKKGGGGSAHQLGGKARARPRPLRPPPFPAWPAWSATTSWIPDGTPVEACRIGEILRKYETPEEEAPLRGLYVSAGQGVSEGGFEPPPGASRTRPST
jgi:hypothetical protein